ncbi:MAG: hypothetical protein CMJ78_20220 [Planctomycetaceae bacterium]|nr:hypothetical protein [Planctomycetaceae bacterium]
MSVTATYDDVEVTIPETAGHSLSSFRHWVQSDVFPDQGRYTYFQRELYADMSPERARSHHNVKARITATLTESVDTHDLGELLPDGQWITHDEADLSTEPDEAFASWETLESGRLRLIKSIDNEDGIELVGTPDWVLEVVSASSFKKDTQILQGAYHAAGIREYWLVAARSDVISFKILQWRQDGYAIAEATDGWSYSAVFDREFQLERFRNRIGDWSHRLHLRKRGDS